ncbi:hypothetical protein [Wenzhouxiangella sp. EGI_FJ10305]|uniref:hypothetical protein n=1 Tax=Wenzhouxiangella sp. EGI_FJ10305 TaxID=3243768 RepID=UPI0035D8B113
MKTFTLTCLAACLALGTGLTRAEEEPSMIETMGDMQYFIHKLELSVRAGNNDLVEFYAHEVEENIEKAQGIEEYHGIRVGELTTAMLIPAFEAFEEAVDGKDHGAVDAGLDRLIKACNACHQATDYGFINIVRRKDNPYMQSFEPEDD